MVLDVVPRTKWDPTSPMSTDERKDIKNVVFINTHSHPCWDQTECLGVIKKLYRIHRGINQLPDLRYNFLIGANGEVYEGIGWNKNPMLPGHIQTLNNKSIMIGFIGSYTALDLPDKLAEASARLIWQGISNNIISKDFNFKNLMNKAYDIQYRLDSMEA